MPRLELSPADHGSRSTLYVSKTGAIYRQYHDTQAWVGPLSAHAGVQGDRFSGNRTVSSLVRAAWSDRPLECEEEHEYRGATTLRRRSAPYHIVRARACLANAADIEALARTLDVKPATAWSYVTQVVDRWPRTHAIARKFVHAPLVEVCEASVPLQGSLHELMDRVQPELSGDTTWRCTTDKYAHLRLARLCVEAARQSSDSHRHR